MKFHKQHWQFESIPLHRTGTKPIPDVQRMAVLSTKQQFRHPVAGYKPWIGYFLRFVKRAK